MKPKTKAALIGGGILLGLFAAHVHYNMPGGWPRFLGMEGGGGGGTAAETPKTAEGALPSAVAKPAGPRQELVVGFIPVTCHLTCPVTNWLTKNSESGSVFRSKKYTDFATICEEFKSGKLQASFILAPLAMQIRRSGTPIKIVHLGHRDGTTCIVPKDSPAKTLADMKGKKMAIPHRYSNQRILLVREMERLGMKEGDITLLDFPPPEHAAAMKSGQVDGYIIGEPHAAKAEMEGFGKVLFFTKDVWPNFISCVLAVSEDLIRKDRPLVQELVNGIAASGKWIDGPGEDLTKGLILEGDGVVESDTVTVFPKGWEPTHRQQAAVIAARKDYYSQPPALLKWVLTKPPDRVRYVDLVPARKDFEEIQRYAEKLGYFKPSTPDDPFGFLDYCDPSFVINAPVNQGK